MKKLFVKFKSGDTLKAEDICDYIESKDFDVVVSRGDKEESHVTIFHDAVEYMCVTDDIEEPEWQVVEIEGETE